MRPVQGQRMASCGTATYWVDGQMQCIAEGTWQPGQAVEQGDSALQSSCTMSEEDV